jgi:hypothetical protein
MNVSMHNSTITGFHGGKSLQVSLRSQPGLTSPRPGAYFLHPPLKDPIFGMFAVLTPAGAQVDTGPTQVLIGLITASLAKGGAKATGITPQSGDSAAVATFLVNQNPGAFVLSNRNLQGKNSLLVITGFADLIEALRSGGGLAVQVR